MKLLTLTLFVLGLSLSSCAILHAVELGYPVTYSSIYNADHQSPQIDSMQRAGVSASAWAAGFNNDQQWIQISSVFPQQWVGVITQGRGDNYEQWVTMYQIDYSIDGKTWRQVDDGLVFKGNYDRTTALEAWFSTPVIARALRIKPVEWHKHISMRVEALIDTDLNQ